MKASDRRSERRVDPLDLLDLDASLSAEERAIRDTVRRFVADNVLPEIGHWFERGEFPRHLLKSLADLGLFGMHLTGYGCAGTNAVSYGLACAELEAGDSDCAAACRCRARWPWQPSGTGVRMESRNGCRGDAHVRAARWRGLGARRNQDVDHQRHDRRRGDHLGADRRGDQRVHRARNIGRSRPARSSTRCPCGPRTPPNRC